MYKTMIEKPNSVYVEYLAMIRETVSKSSMTKVVEYDVSDDSYFIPGGIEDRQLLCVLPWYYRNIKVGYTIRVRFGEKDNPVWLVKYIKEHTTETIDKDSNELKFGYDVELTAPNTVQTVTIDIDVQ